MRILLSGVPATGKSTSAEYLAANHGFTHFDIEEAGITAIDELHKTPDVFLGKLATGNVVISWGFIPFIDRTAVDSLLAAGFTFVWLDGDRVASFREFMKREGGSATSQDRYHMQMHRIISTELVERFKPLVIDPFDGDGQFRDIAAVVGDIIAVAGRKSEL